MAAVHTARNVYILFFSLEIKILSVVLEADYTREHALTCSAACCASGFVRQWLVKTNVRSGSCNLFFSGLIIS